MTKNELVEAVAKAADISKNAANSALDAAFENIARAIRKEKRFQVPSFGTFTVRSRKAHQGRDPQTGSTINIKASKTVGFKPAPTLPTESRAGAALPQPPASGYGEERDLPPRGPLLVAH